MLITWQDQSLSLHKFDIWYCVYFSGFGYFPDWEIPQSKEHPKCTNQTKQQKPRFGILLSGPKFKTVK